MSTLRVSEVLVQAYWPNSPTTVSFEQFFSFVADVIQAELRSATVNAIPHFRLLLQGDDKHLRVLGAYAMVNLAEYSEFPQFFFSLASLMYISSSTSYCCNRGRHPAAPSDAQGQ